MGKKANSATVNDLNRILIFLKETEDHHCASDIKRNTCVSSDKIKSALLFLFHQNLIIKENIEDHPFYKINSSYINLKYYEKEKRLRKKSQY